ncbi:hypothetical protein, partial [Alicyclobacillus sendaiensis]|uniref:hypothetical protein n=1 Tax=Alicyclobacillus sendaiensis TaxID=192387 RepID=UPI001C3F3C43
MIWMDVFSWATMCTGLVLATMSAGALTPSSSIEWFAPDSTMIRPETCTSFNVVVPFAPGLT